MKSLASSGRRLRTQEKGRYGDGTCAPTQEGVSGCAARRESAAFVRAAPQGVALHWVISRGTSAQEVGWGGRVGRQGGEVGCAHGRQGGEVWCAHGWQLMKLRNIVS